MCIYSGRKGKGEALNCKMKNEEFSTKAGVFEKVQDETDNFQLYELYNLYKPLSIKYPSANL